MTPKQLKKLSKEEIQELINDCRSMNQFFIKMKMIYAGGNVKTVREFLSHLEVDLSHQTGMGWAKGSISRKAFSENEVFQVGIFRKGSILKPWLLKKGVPNECAICHNEGIWERRLLVLEVDHINGDRYNNLLENLRILCPNCHSQTDTFRRKNAKVVSGCNRKKCDICDNLVYRQSSVCRECSNKRLNKNAPLR